MDFDSELWWTVNDLLANLRPEEVRGAVRFVALEDVPADGTWEVAIIDGMGVAWAPWPRPVGQLTHGADAYDAARLLLVMARRATP